MSSYENIFNPTVARLGELVQKQYGCEFSYQNIDELNDEHGLNGPLHTNLLRGDTINAGDWVFFPIFLGAQLAGAARISRRDHLSNDDIKTLHQMIRMVLESKLHDIDRIEILDKLESHMLQMRDESQRLTNLIQFRDYQTNPFPIATTPPAHQQPAVKNPIGGNLNFPFLIESRTADDIFKMAFEIHTRTTRYAFLPIEDISPHAFDSAEGLCGLGAITIFISDITQLNFELQNKLVSYYASARDRDCPQIIAGSPVPISELKKSCKVSKDLLQSLMVGYLCMNQPFAVYKRENVLDFFYDSLTGRSST